MGTLRTAINRPGLRRLLLAYGLFRAAEMATWVTLLVWAFERGGANAAGIIAVGQLVPATLAAPLGSVLTTRMARSHALLLGYLLQAGTKAVTAVAIFGGAPFWLVTVAAGIAASTTTLTRPVHHAVVPEIARSPEELTAGNAASTAVEGIADFVGPAIAGVLLAVAEADTVFAAMAIAGLASAWLTRGAAIVGVGSRDQPTSYWADAAEGLTAAVRDPGPRALTAILAVKFVVIGLLDILAVVLAIDVLGTGPSGPGFMTSGLGIGALLGAIAAVTMAGRRRLGLPLAAGVLTVGVAVVLVSVSSNFVLAVALFGVAGAGRSTVDITARTLLQRSVPPRILARILGVQEALVMAGTAVGATAGPILLLLAGLRGAFLVTATLLPAVGLAASAQIRRLDRAAPSAETVRLLRAVEMFSWLPVAQLEQLASTLRPLPPLDDGEVFIHQGEVGDRCYVIVRGSVAIDRDGRRLAELGPGQVVGEIALLRPVARTATARAIGTVELASLEREPFLLAVTGSDQSYRVVDSQVRRRLDGQDPSGGVASGDAPA